jgi:uncharacterized membrane protein
MDDVLIARALHVLAVVIWIGGVAMVTTVVLPAVRHGDLVADRLGAFRAIERRFVWQARTAIALDLVGNPERSETRNTWWQSLHMMTRRWREPDSNHRSRERRSASSWC